MSYPPLIPLPRNSNDNSPAIDPFEELLQPPSARSSNPIFPTPLRTTPISISTRAKPIDTSNNGIVSPSDDFGAFVSVEPTDDPLHAQTEFSPADEHPPALTSFVHGASERAESNERRIMDELIHHQDDPLYFVEPTVLPPNEELEGARALNEAFEDSLIDIGSAFDPPLASAPMASSHSIEPKPLTTIPRNASFPSASPSPPPRSGSLSQRLSSTLPRKWSTLLTSSSPPLPTFLSTSPQIEPAQLNPPITHSSPFAASVYIPPSGAPGMLACVHLFARIY